jgi:hypothetical protein
VMREPAEEDGTGDHQGRYGPAPGEIDPLGLQIRIPVHAFEWPVGRHAFSAKG